LGKLAETTDTTAKSVLVKREGHFFSKQTAERVHRAIDREADDLRKYLNRLSGGATG
jgi:hypothetical protein